MPDKNLVILNDQEKRILSLISKTVLYFGLALTAGVLIYNSWLSDDAFISFRATWNFIHGYGLRWNIDNRVQAFTNPLWTLISAVPLIVFKQSPTAIVFWCLLWTGLAIGILVFGILKNKPGRQILALAFLVLSKSFIDFSSSGLENPLNFALAAAFAWAYFSQMKIESRLKILGYLSAALCLNRLDNILLITPPILSLVWSKDWRKHLYILMRSLWPLALWETFAVIYYGSPFPNTVFVKIGSLPFSQALSHGFYYLTNSLSWDPITVLMIWLISILAVLSKNKKNIWLMAGTLIHMAYTVGIGGDFMSGRFFATSFFIAICCLLNTELDQIFWLASGFLVIFAGIVSAPRSPLMHPLPGAPRTMEYVISKGIADEGTFYCSATCLVNISERFSSFPWFVGINTNKSGEEDIRGAIGITGFYGGPNYKIIDPHALSDAFLARLPGGNWYRPGHVAHRPPEGYLATIKTGENRLTDPGLKQFYGQIQEVVAAPIWSVKRFAKIMWFNSEGLSYPPEKGRWLTMPILAIILLTIYIAWLLGDSMIRVLSTNRKRKI